MVKCLTIFVTVLTISGCCSVPPHVPFECPDRPELSEYTVELWSEIPEQAQLNISADDLALKDYVKQCEARAEIHNQ